jgi:hypothetical protein
MRTARVSILSSSVLGLHSAIHVLFCSDAAMGSRQIDLWGRPNDCGYSDRCCRLLSYEVQERAPDSDVSVADYRNAERFTSGRGPYLARLAG